MDECLGAINEAEDVAGDKDPEVWLQVRIDRESTLDGAPADPVVLSHSTHCTSSLQQMTAMTSSISP